MIVKAPEQRFPTAPQGTMPAVCVDEIDLGIVENKFDPDKPRHMVRLVWQIDEIMPDSEAQKFNLPIGSRYIIKNDYTASLDEKAKLRKHLESWRGQAFTPAELSGFDLENCVGVPCLLSIVHNPGKQGGVFSNIAGVMKPPKGMESIKPEGYVRIKDRPAAPVVAPLVSQPKHQAPLVEEEPPTQDYDPHHITDDDVPF